MSKRQYSKRQPAVSSNNSSLALKPVQEETQQMRQAREREMIDNLNRESIHHYLRGLEVTSYTDQMASRITKSSAEKIVYSLKNGAIEIPKNPPPLPQKPSNQQRLSNEQIKQLENKAKRENIAKKIEYLNDQIRGQTPADNEKEGNLQVDFKDILTKEQHQRKIRQILQDKFSRKKRIEQFHEEQIRKQKQEEEKKQALKLIEQQKQKEQKRMKIQDHIQKRKQEHDKFIQLGLRLQKQMLDVKQKSKLYQQMEKRYQSQILLPSLQEKKNKLKQIRDFHKRYDVETIKEHEKRYLQKSLERSQEKQSKSPQWKYDPPFRTERLQKFLKDEEVEMKQQMQSRKRKQQEMQKRQVLYKLELKQKHKPKVDDDKKKQIEIRLIQQRRKYQKIHPNIDQRRLGESYLEIAKKMKRSESVNQKLNQEKEDHRQLALKQKEETISLSRINHNQQFYQDIRRKKMDVIINSQEKTISEKYMMLKMQTQKLGQKLKQKEELAKYKKDEQFKNDAAQLLLSSIKAKMGIMNLLKNNVHSEEDESI